MGSYNVTEDADLGLRLYRAGYRTRAAHHVTVETAPEEIGVWIRQRSRWLKGWLQTWLVLMRHPLTVARQVGPAGFVTLQILIAGMLGSVLLHPAMLVFVVLWLLPLAMGITDFPSGWSGWLLALDLFNIVGSYCAFLALGRRHLAESERPAMGARRIAMLPFYWLAMSLAGWRAVRHLFGRAHYWDKTPHPAPVDQARAPKEPKRN